MELRIYFQMLMRSWWVVFLTALTALAIALATSLFITPIYRATGRFVVNPNLDLVRQADVVRSLEALDKRSIVATYAEVLNSDRIYNDAVTSLQGEVSNFEDYTHTTVVLPEANILELSVEGPDPRVAALLANSIGQRAIDYIQQLYTVYEINFLDPATVPVVPIRPQPIRDSAFAVALGLLIGSVLAILREQLRTPIEAFLRRSEIDSESMAFNRHYVEDRLEDALARSPTSVFSFSLVQLSGLGGFTDLMPQPIVQNVLRQITETLKAQLRGNDIVGRWDDNTFSVILFDTPGQAAVSTMGRVQLALSEPMRFGVDGERLNLRPKIGIVERQPGDPADLILQRAETALDQSFHDESGLVLFKQMPFGV